jgi:hypothetical protein
MKTDIKETARRAGITLAFFFDRIRDLLDERTT